MSKKSIRIQVISNVTGNSLSVSSLMTDGAIPNVGDFMLIGHKEKEKEFREEMVEIVRRVHLPDKTHYQVTLYVRVVTDEEFYKR